MFPRILQQLTSKIKEDDQQAIKEKDNKIQAHQQKILKLNAEIIIIIYLFIVDQ